MTLTYLTARITLSHAFPRGAVRSATTSHAGGASIATTSARPAHSPPWCPDTAHGPRHITGDPARDAFRQGSGGEVAGAGMARALRRGDDDRGTAAAVKCPVTTVTLARREIQKDAPLHCGDDRGGPSCRVR
ncbi:hypothetical protein MRX96_053035 [Rhipicephalus microplus]